MWVWGNFVDETPPLLVRLLVFLLYNVVCRVSFGIQLNAAQLHLIVHHSEMINFI